MQWFSGFNQPLLELEEMMLMADYESEVVVEEAVAASFSWRALMLVVYWAGVVFFLLRHLWSLGRMLRLVKHCRKEYLENGIRLFVHDNNKVAPFSWMKIIVIAEEDLKENEDAILKHECAHVKYGHSWDLLLAELCVILQWFNPAAWLMKQELQNIHEYEADEWVIQNGIDAKRYQLLIIKKAVGARLYSIANSFNHSSLKKRITMMIKKKSNPWARMKYLYVLPMAAIAVAAFARPEVSNELNEISSVKVNDLASIMKIEEVKSVENSLEEKFVLKGQVMEYSSKKPVSGASVLIQGTTMGTLADKDGRFQLSVKKGDVLVVSFVGLKTQFLPIEGNANLVVWLKGDVQSKEEMVVGTNSADSDKKGVEVKFAPNNKPVVQEGQVFTVVEEMPQFPGGMAEAMKFLAKNINYPAEAQKAKIEGRVIVQFVVKEDGKVSDAKVVRSINPDLDAEALRVIGLMPEWIPGKQRGKAVAVKYTMPIMFRLGSPAPKEESASSMLHVNVEKDADRANLEEVKTQVRNQMKNMPVRGAEGKSPLVVVDGKEVGFGANKLSEIPIGTIQLISVLNEKNSVAKYGEKAKDGAIEVTTKKK